jgi:phage-related protein
MSDSVGKISLDLEVKSDLGKQISSISGIIAKNLKTSLNTGTKSMFDGMKRNANSSVKSLDSGIKSTLSKMKTNLKSTMKSVFESVKNTKLPPIKFSKTEVPKPNVVNIPKANNFRGPPKRKSIDKEVLTTQIESTARELDVVNARIEQQRQKLSQLRESFRDTFNIPSKNKIQEQMLKTEASISGLITKSDKLGFKLADLDARLGAVGTVKAISGVNSLSNATANASKGSSTAMENLNRFSSSLNQLGISSKKTSGNIGGTNSQLKMIIRSMITWGMIFPLVIRGISAMATSLGQSLMTNQQFANSLAQIKTNLMVAFMPIYNAILPAINALMSALATLTTYIASFISALFGKTYQQSVEATQGLIDAKAAMGAYGESAKKAGKDAKDALGLAGFDEINALNSQKDSGDSDGGGGNVPTLVAPPLDISPVDSVMSELAEKVKKVFATIFQPFKNAWAKDGASVILAMKKSIDATKDTFKRFYNVLETPPVQLFIENISRIGLSLIKLALSIYREFILPIIDWFISLLPVAANGLNPILDAVRRFIDYLASNGELLRWIISLVLGVVAGFKTLVILVEVAKWIVKVKEALTVLWTLLMANPIILIIAGIVALVVAFMSLYASSETFRNKINEIGSAIMDFLAPAFEFLKEKALQVWNDALVPFGEFLLDLWKTVLEPLTKIIGDVLVMAFKAVMDIVKSLWEGVLQPLVSFIVDIFIKAIQGIIDIYEAWKPAIQMIIDILLFLWDNVLKPLVNFIINVFLDSFRNTFKTIGSLIDNLKRILGGIIDFVAGVFTGDWSRAWNGVKDIFGGIMGGLGTLIKSPLNAVISLVNSAIGGINSISVDIPDWVPMFGGSHFGLSLPNIPYLAKGGIIDSPTLAMVGEAGKEAVVPLENNTQGLDLLASKLMERLGGVNTSSSNNSFGDGDLILQIDGSVIGKVALKQLRKMQRQGNITLIPV